MAEKVKLFELDIDIDKLIDNSGKVNREIKKLVTEQKALTKTSKDLKKQIDEQNKAMKESEKAGNYETYKQQKQVLNELEKQYEDTTRGMAKNQSELKVARKEYNMSLKMIDAYGEKQRKELGIIKQTDGSIDQLSAALSKNRAVYRSLSKDQRENSEVGGKLLKLIQEQDKEYKRLQVGMGNTNVMVGDYKESIKAAFKEMNFFNKGMQDLAGQVPLVGGVLSQLVGTFAEYVTTQKAAAAATEGTSKTLKLFKIALISTGIGAIVVVIGTLVAAFLSTQKGIDAVNRYLKPLGVILQRLWGVLQKVGEKMVDTFTHPKQAIAGLWKFIKSQLVNRVTGMIDTFKFVGKAINAALHLDFEGVKENAAKVSESVIQSVTGVDNFTQKLKNAASETGKFFRDSWKTGQELADLTVKIEKTENDMILKRSMLNAEYEKQKEIAQDVKKTEAERRVAAQKAIEIQNQLLHDEQALLDMKIKKKRAELALNDTDRAAQKELNELIAQRTEFEAQASRKRVSAMNLEKTIDAQIKAKQLADAKEAVELAINNSKTKLALYIAENKDRAKTLNDELNYERKVHNEKVELLKQELKAKKISQDEYDVAVIEAKKELAKKEAEITIEHAQKELDLYIAQHQSKLDADKAFTAESVKQEQDRLYGIYNKQKEFLDKQHADGLISEEDYQLKLLQLKQGYIAQKQDLDKQVDQQIRERRQADWENDLEIKRLQGVSEFELQRQQLEKKYQAEIQNAKKTGADLTKINKKYALINKKITEEETKARAQEYTTLFGNIANLLGKNTAAGKAAAIAQAMVNTYLGVTEVWAAKSVLPSPFDVITKIANTAVVVASGLESVGAIKNTPTPKAEDGLMIDIGGNRHSSGGTKFYGEDGTYFEAEKDEKLFVLNRLASKALGPSLSKLNVATGGRPLWQTSSFMAAGGAVARQISGTQSATVKLDSTIDYEKLSTLNATKTGSVLGEKLKELPRPVTDVKDIITEVDNYNEVVNGANI